MDGPTIMMVSGMVLMAIGVLWQLKRLRDAERNAEERNNPGPHAGHERVK